MNNLVCGKKVLRRPCPEPGPQGRLSRTGFPQGPAEATVQNPSIQRKPSRKLLISLLKSVSFLRRSSIFRLEWITVEWCFPPKLAPISASDACVNDLHKYIAICLGMATDLELLRDFNSTIFKL